MTDRSCIGGDEPDLERLKNMTLEEVIEEVANRRYTILIGEEGFTAVELFFVICLAIGTIAMASLMVRLLLGIGHYIWSLI